jgi:hypothetical protein
LAYDWSSFCEEYMFIKKAASVEAVGLFQLVDVYNGSMSCALTAESSFLVTPEFLLGPTDYESAAPSWRRSADYRS